MGSIIILGNKETTIPPKNVLFGAHGKSLFEMQRLCILFGSVLYHQQKEAENVISSDEAKSPAGFSFQGSCITASKCGGSLMRMGEVMKLESRFTSVGN